MAPQQNPAKLLYPQPTMEKLELSNPSEIIDKREEIK